MNSENAPGVNLDAILDDGTEVEVDPWAHDESKCADCQSGILSVWSDECDYIIAKCPYDIPRVIDECNRGYQSKQAFTDNLEGQSVSEVWQKCRDDKPFRYCPETCCVDGESEHCEMYEHRTFAEFAEKYGEGYFATNSECM